MIDVVSAPLRHILAIYEIKYSEHESRHGQNAEKQYLPPRIQQYGGEKYSSNRSGSSYGNIGDIILSFKKVEKRSRRHSSEVKPRISAFPEIQYVKRILHEYAERP